MLDWQKHKKLGIFIRTVCIVLIVSFLSYDLSWAGATEVLNPKNWHVPHESQSSPVIEIPQELGTIKETYLSKYNPYKLIIHIQDAHANVEAQENEAKLIKYLKDKYKVNLVSVEGGFGDFDAEFFRNFPKDKKIRERIARYFLSRAFISGTDYLLITEDEPPAIYGAEDKELYASHLNTFRQNQDFSDSLNKSLGVIEGVIETLKARYYSKDLKEFDSRVNDFRQGRTSLEEYLSYLNILSIIHNFDLSKFPNLSRIINLQELEDKINFEQAETERQELIDTLTKALSKQDLEELVKRSLDFKANNRTPAEYYSYLEGLSKDAGIQAKDYKNLFTYIKYVLLSENLDNSQVLKEIDAFTESLKEKLITNGTQKDIDSLTYIIRILKGLSNINLSPKDYEYFKKNRDAFTSESIGLALRRYNSDIVNSLPTDEDIASLEKFYRLAYTRDNAIVSNSLDRLNRDYSSNSVVLVAGGFHTQGITSILKEKDISYLVIAPNIKQSQDRETVYFSLLKEKKLPLQDVLNDPDTLQIINSISDNEARQLLITYWVARASRYYSFKELQAQLERIPLSSDDQRAVETALSEISESIPTSHKEVKEIQEGMTAGKQEQSKPVPAPALKTKHFSFRRFILSFVAAFALFIFTGCASTFQMRLGPFQLRNDAVVTASQFQKEGKILDVSGKISLGSGQVDANTAKGQLDLSLGAKAKVGPLSVGIEPTVSLVNLKPGASPIDLKFNIRPPEEKKPQAPSFSKESLDLKGQIRADVLPVVGEVKSSLGLSNVPKDKPPFELKAGVSLSAEKIKDSKGEELREALKLNTEGGLRLGPLTGEVKPSFGLKELKENDRPLDLQGKIYLDKQTKEKTEQKAAQEEVKPATVLEQQPRETLTQKDQIVQKTQQETQEKQSALEELRSQQEKTQAAFSAVQEGLAKANQENQRVKIAIERLVNEQKASQEKIKVLEEKKQTLESEISGLKERLDNSEKRLSRAEEKISNFEEYQRSWWQGLGAGWKAILSILAGFGIGVAFLRLGLYRSWQRLRQLKDEVAQKQGEKLNLEKELEASRAALQVLAAAAEQAKLSLAETEKRRQAQEEEIRQAKVEFENLKIGTETGITQKGNFRQRIEQLQKDILAISQELSLAISEEENKLSGLKANVAQLEKEQAHYEKIMRALKKKADEYQAALSVLKQEKDRVEASIDEGASAARIQIEEMNKKVQESEEVLKGLREEVERLENNKKNLQSQIAGYQTQKEKLEAEISDSTQKSQNLTQTIASLQSQQNSLVQKETELKASIDAKISQLKDIENQISILQTKGTEEGLQIPALKEQKAFLEVELAKLSQYVADLNREAAEIKKKIEASQKSLAGLEKEKENLAAEVKTIEAKRDSLKDEIVALETQKTALNTQIRNLSTVLSNTQKELSQAQDALKSLLTEIERLESKKTAIVTEEIAVLERQRDILKQEIEDLAKEKLRLEEELRKTKVPPAPKPPVTKDIEAINKAKQEYTDIALQFQEVRNITDKNLFADLCKRLETFTASLDIEIRQEVSEERNRANKELLNAKDRLIQAAERIRKEIKSEIENLSRLDNSANFEQRLSELQTRYPPEIISEFNEAIQKAKESVAQKEKLAEEARRKATDLIGDFTQRYQAIIEQAYLAMTQEELEEIETNLETLNNEARQKPEVLKAVEPLQKEAQASITKREAELKTASKSLYRRIPLATLWMIFRRYLLLPWWIGLQLHNALSDQGLAEKVNEVYKRYLTVFDWFKREDFYKAFKQKSEQLGLSKAFDEPGIVSEFNVKDDRKTYHLELSNRSPEYLVRGYFSGDCTNPAFPFAHTSFQSATLNHLMMPGFFNFKVMRGREWIGNIYAAVVEDNGKPVLLIDAVQIPWRVWGGIFLQPSGAYAPFWLPFKLFPIWTFRKATRISDASLKALEQYAQEVGFAEIWHSHFVSNFYDFKDHYQQIAKENKYPESPGIDQSMVIGWSEFQQTFHPDYLYIESLNKRAWKIWVKDEKVKQAVTQKPAVEIKEPSVPKTAGQFIAEIAEGKHITSDTQRFLKDVLGITPLYLSQSLSQRLKESSKVREVIEILASGISISDWMRNNPRESSYNLFEREITKLGINPDFDKPGLIITFGVDGDKRSYVLVLSKRDADDLVRGYISGDCTNPSGKHSQYSFSKYIPNHLLSPGFLNFKVYRSEPHAPPKWIGNVYAAILRQNNLGVLLIDAIQIPWAGIEERFGMQLLPLPPPYNGRRPTLLFPVKSLKEAEKISEAIIAVLSYQYATQYGFKKTYIGFGSNFIPLVEHFYKTYPTEYTNTLLPSEIIQRGGAELGPAVRLPSEISALSESEYLRKRKTLDLQTVGIDEEHLGSFDNRRGFAEIEPVRAQPRTVTLYGIDPLFGYIALTGWLIYLGYRGIKWLINRHRQNIPYQREEVTSIVPVEDARIATVVSEGVLETRFLGVLLPLTEEERTSIQLRLGSVVDRVTQGSIDTWPQTFIKAFKRGKTKILWELPLPVPVSRIRREPSPRNQAIMILRLLKIWMDAADSRVIRDLRRGIEEAREAVTEEALANLNNLSDGQLVELLTTEYQRKFSKEIDKNIKRFIDHVRRFQGPSPEERGLYVSDEIQSRYERLPRYLKWIFSQNPGLDQDSEIQALIKIVNEQMMQLPTFSSEIEDFAKDALSESIRLNPELGLRLFEYMTKDLSTHEEILLRLKSEQARVTYLGTSQLEGARGQRTPIAALPDSKQSEEALKRQENLINSLRQALEEFKAKLSQRRNDFLSKEKDLKELTEAYEDAKRAGENYTADVLSYAKEGAEAEVKRLKQEISSLEEKVRAYQVQIQDLGGNQGGKGVTLYSITGLPLAAIPLYAQIKELLVSYGLPDSNYFIIPLLILGPWLIATTFRVLIRHIFPAKSEPVKVRTLFLSKGLIWTMLVFPLVMLFYFPFFARPWSLMGRQGLYSYWENRKPGHYRIFKEETQGLSKDFRRPGEKFRVAYDRKNVNLDPSLMQDPVRDELTETKDFLRRLSEIYPDFYKRIKNIIYGKRTEPEYRELFEVITEGEIKDVMTEIINRIQSWNMPNDKRVEIMQVAAELALAEKTTKLRRKIFNARELPKKARLNAEYWQKIIDSLKDGELVPQNSKVLVDAVSIFKKRVSLFGDQSERPRRGLLQFYLSGVTFADLFSGNVSQDCTACIMLYFFNFLTTKLDPAFMLFKIMENGRWVGNLYTMVLKDSDGKEALLLDSFQVNTEHPLLNATDGQLNDAMSTFLERFKLYLSRQGFKEILVGGTAISSRSKIDSKLRTLIQQQGTAISGNFRKPGGARYRLNMFAFAPSYIQALGTVSKNLSFSGHKIMLPETLQEVEKERKEQELQQLHQKLNLLLKEAEATEAHLQERQAVLQELSASLEREKQNGREASVTVLSGELEKVNTAVADLGRKRNDIRARISPDERRLDELRRGLGLLGSSKKISKGKKAVAAALLVIGFLLATSKEAFASGSDSIRDHPWASGDILVIFAVAVGIFFYILYRNFKEWFRVTRNGVPDISELIEGIYQDKVNRQLRTGRVVLDARTQEQIKSIQKIADEFSYLFHPETEDPDELAFSIIEKIKTAPLDKDIKEELMAALSLNLSWAKERIRFIRKLRFTQKDTLIDQRRLVERLSEYLGIPSKSGKEEVLRDYIASQLKKLGGSEYKIPLTTSSYYKTPNNLIWDIPASENYKGEPLRIGLHAHLDTGTHTPTLLRLEGNFLIAEGKGKYAEAGLDDACALAVIMETLEVIKEKQILHPDLRIIFTAEEEAGPSGVDNGARYLVKNHTELFEEIDLLISVDGPLLDKKSPLSVKFINFGKARERIIDSSYKAVIDVARKVSGNENVPKEFDFSAGDEQAFREIEGLRIAHFRANYAQGHTEKDGVELEHLILLTEWVTGITSSLNKKPAPRPSIKKTAREQLFNSIELLSRGRTKEGIAKVIANSGKLAPGMEFLIYEDFPRKKLLRFKYQGLGRLVLVEYLSGHRPEYYEVSIDDESIFDAAGNVFIMELLRSKTALVTGKNGREIYLASLLRDYAIPQDFNPEVGGLVVKDPDNSGKAKVVEFFCKGFIQLGAVTKGTARYSPVKRLVPFVHLGATIKLDRFGRFKGLVLPNLYDSIKSRYGLQDIALSFHSHPDDVFSPPRFSYLDLEEVRRQNRPVILPLELVIGKHRPCFFYHFQDGDAEQINQIELSLDKIINAASGSSGSDSLVSFNQWLNSLSLLVSGERRFSAKGKGMFTLRGRDQLEQVILEAKEEERGYLVWGDSKEWEDNREEYMPEIKSIIGYLGNYSYAKIPKLGIVNIPKALATSNVILIRSRDGSAGLVVNDAESFQVAFSDVIDNSIKIDAAVYSSLSYNYAEKVALLAHEAILLGAMRLAKEKNIPWALKLANDTVAVAEDFEVQIAGRHSKGKGSRLDERIEEILGFDTPMREMRISTASDDEGPKTTALLEDRNAPFILDNLRELLENLARNPSANLPARLEQFPAPIAHEIRKAYLLRKVKGLPIDVDFLAVLSVFFARLFPNHVDKMLKYHSRLLIYVIDNKRSTFGATLRGNTLYIQRTCIEDLLGRPISVKEIYQAIEDKDRDVAIALFRIIIHEIGGAFFKLSHEANQDLEKIFLAALSKTKPQLSPKTEQEIRDINAKPDLDNLPRKDWAEAETFIHDSKTDKIVIEQFDNLPAVFIEEAVSDLESALFDADQNARNSAARTLAQIGSIKSLTFLRLIQEKEPENGIIKEAIASLEQKVRVEQAQKIKDKLPDPFVNALFTLNTENDLVLTPAAVQAINLLCIDYTGLTLEIDVDALIDTSKGIPQLKGYGFKEVLSALYKAKEDKEIPEDLHVRLINLNPHLDKTKIVRALELEGECLKGLLSILEVFGDYRTRGIEHYLIPGSIRVVFEDNLKYWGKKVDVLVKRGKETETLSSLGLIVAALAKEPKFYEQLPKELKEYIVAKTDEKGNIELDDEGKIKQLIFKPIEKTKVDTQYLEQLDKANKELEGMV